MRRRPPYQRAHGAGCGRIQAQNHEVRPPKPAVSDGGQSSEIFPGADRPASGLHQGPGGRYENAGGASASPRGQGKAQTGQGGTGGDGGGHIRAPCPS